MSRIDHEAVVDQDCRRLETSIPVMLGATRKNVREVLEAHTTQAVDFLCELLGRPETAALAERMIRERRQAARDAAIAECQEYLRKYVIEEVMES